MLNNVGDNMLPYHIPLLIWNLLLFVLTHLIVLSYVCLIFSIILLFISNLLKHLIHLFLRISYKIMKGCAVADGLLWHFWEGALRLIGSKRVNDKD
jgi:hypothetical protein